MRAPSLAALLMLALPLAVASACAGTGVSDTDSGTSGDGDGGGDGDGTHDTYVDGISKSGAVFTVAIMAATPSPPDRGDNTWTLMVTRGDTPLSGADVVVSPFMPAHNHGTTPADYTGAESTDTLGEYVAGPFDLFMPGAWRFNVAVSEGGDEEDLEFFFDIEG